MDTQDFAKLMKVMGMTTSAHDGEALSAIRAANKILVAHKLTWQDVFSGLIKVEQPPPSRPSPPPRRPSPHRYDDDEEFTIDFDIDEAFETVRETLRPGGFADFIDSLEKQWDEKGSLSSKQRRALYNAAQRAGAW